MTEIKDNESIINSIKRREKILSDIAKKNGIRIEKPEYQIILDVLQEISPTTWQELLKEINETHECEMLTYKQLYDNIKTL